MANRGHHGDPATNVARLAALLPSAKASGVELLLAPELWTTGYNDPEAIRTFSEPADGPTRRAIAQLAREFSMAIAWGFPEQDGDTRYNSAQLVGPDGSSLLTYRKVHLWADYEKRLFTPGPFPGAPAEWNGWRIAFSICYDTEFPELVRRQTLAGADLLLAPTALGAGVSFIPDAMVPVRAVENCIFIAFCNRAGKEGDLTYHGGSSVLSPMGEKIAAATETEQLIVADMDLEARARAKERNPYLVDRRADLLSS